MRRVLLALAALVALSTGCGSAKPPDLETFNVGWSRLNWGVRAVSGFVRNNTDVPFDSVTVTIETFDANGRSQHRVRTDVGEIDPHRIRSFGTGYLPGRPEKFRVVAISGRSREQAVQSPRWGDSTTTTSGTPSGR